MYRVREWEGVGTYILKSIIGLLTVVGLLALLGTVSRLVSIAFMWGWGLIK